MRTGIEVTALVVGVALGGSVGLGTLAFAFTIGPNVQLFLPRLTARPSQRPQAQVVLHGGPQPAAECC